MREEEQDDIQENEQRFNFGQVLEHLKASPIGNAATREGWNGKGMSIMLQVPDEHSKMSLPYIYMRTTDGKLVPWLASQTDMLAEDWLLLTDNF